MDRLAEQLAEQLAEGRSLAIAATRTGMSVIRAEALFHRICIRLGPQADG